MLGTQELEETVAGPQCVESPEEDRDVQFGSFLELQQRNEFILENAFVIFEIDRWVSLPSTCRCEDVMTL